MRPSLLIVDDTPDQLELMRMVFGMVNPGVEVRTALGRDEMFSLLRSEPVPAPKVILLDLRMVGSHGIRVLKELKADPRLRRIPVCVFSTGDVPSDVCESYENGASFYFKKPCGLDELQRFAGLFLEIWFDFASLCEN